MVLLTVVIFGAVKKRDNISRVCLASVVLVLLSQLDLSIALKTDQKPHKSLAALAASA